MNKYINQDIIIGFFKDNVGVLINKSINDGYKGFVINLIYI